MRLIIYIILLNSDILDKSNEYSYTYEKLCLTYICKKLLLNQIENRSSLNLE